MSDEALLACGAASASTNIFATPLAHFAKFKNSSDLKYDMKTYRMFNEVMRGVASELGAGWNADDVQRAVFASRVLSGGGGAAGSAVPKQEVGATANDRRAKFLGLPLRERLGVSDADLIAVKKVVKKKAAGDKGTKKSSGGGSSAAAKKGVKKIIILFRPNIKE